MTLKQNNISCDLLHSRPDDVVETVSDEELSFLEDREDSIVSSRNYFEPDIKEISESDHDLNSHSHDICLADIFNKSDTVHLQSPEGETVGASNAPGELIESSSPLSESSLNPDANSLSFEKDLDANKK